jgi:hypothetical protein
MGHEETRINISEFVCGALKNAASVGLTSVFLFMIPFALFGAYAWTTLSIGGTLNLPNNLDLPGIAAIFTIMGLILVSAVRGVPGTPAACFDLNICRRLRRLITRDR